MGLEAVAHEPSRSGAKFGAALAAGVVLALLAALWIRATDRRRRHGRLIGHTPARRLQGSLQGSPTPISIPADYRAAGVIFFTSAEDGEISQLLLGVEERKVRLRELGRGAGGTRNMPVLIFPQGKREAWDSNFVATAQREFLEETGHSAVAAELDSFVEAAESSTKDLPATYFEYAKMGVIFCEVPSKISELRHAVSPGQKQVVRPVWVRAKELREALMSPHADAEVRTAAGPVPLFPMTRRFLTTDYCKRWLALAPRPRARR
mmetsp:Transcript_8051/g.18820  ORF Transcript_8051/g.18820 Transcript_8051/m.18820 type:complete len:264 (+) Transcript_8051:50-841(+)